MRKTTYTESAHTATTAQPPAEASQATNGLPNRLMTAFEVAEFIGCHEETVRRAYLRGLLTSQRFGVRGRTTNRYLARLRHICNWAIGRDLLSATPFHRRGLRIVTKNERRRDRRIREVEEQQLLDACKLLNEPARGNAKLTWDVVQKIRARAQTNVTQAELARIFNIPQSLCSEIVSGDIWQPDAKLTTGDEMRDRIISALDTGCRCGEMMKIQNKHVDGNIAGFGF